MHFWSKVADFLKLPEPYNHVTGWAFDGKRVFRDTFAQSNGLRDGDIPPAKSDWWWSYLVRKSFRRDWIFETESEAVEYALEYIQLRIRNLEMIRKNIIRKHRGHLKPVKDRDST